MNLREQIGRLITYNKRGFIGKLRTLTWKSAIILLSFKINILISFDGINACNHYPSKLMNTATSQVHVGIVAYFCLFLKFKMTFYYIAGPDLPSFDYAVPHLDELCS